MIELARRIAITIGALLLFRLGSHIPIAGTVTPSGLFAPGTVTRLSIFSLSLIPYLSAAIIVQLISVVWRRLSALERSGEAGRQKLARITLVLTLLLASFQALGIASAMQNISGLVVEPGNGFMLSTTATLVGGVFFLIWLSEQITRHGVGNGIALILSVGILISIPGEVAGALELARRGAITNNTLQFYAVVWIVLVTIMVLVESARRNVAVQYVARQVGQRRIEPQSSVLSIKVNSAGFLIPSTVTPWVFYLPLALATYLFGQTSWLATAYGHLRFGEPVHIILGSIVIFVLAFIYVAYVLDPERAADTLLKQGGVIEGVMPGEPTADQLDRVASLTTVVGAVYLVAVSLIPEVLVAGGEPLPYKISGGSVLIVVCTILDLKIQVRDLSLTTRGGERK